MGLHGLRRRCTRAKRVAGVGVGIQHGQRSCRLRIRPTTLLPLANPPVRPIATLQGMGVIESTPSAPRAKRDLAQIKAKR